MVLTIVVGVAAFVAGVLVERNNVSIGNILVGVKAVIVEVYDAIANLFHRS